MQLSNILVIDDDFEDRFLIETAFNDLGYADALCFAENGEKALHMLDTSFTTHTFLPKLVVLDLNMPKMNGTEVLKLLKQHTEFRNIQVIIFSTTISDREKEECIKYGIDGYMLKPLTYTDFLTSVRTFYDVSLT